MKKFIFLVLAMLLATTNVLAQDVPKDTSNFTRENIKIFPLPSNGLFNFRVDSPGETFLVRVYDILGKEVYFNWNFVSGKKYTIDLRYETPLDAIYFAIFTNSKEEKVVKKIVINPQLNE